jgi:hypothetical protein
MFILTKIAITMFILLATLIFICHCVYGTGKGLKKRGENFEVALGGYVLLTIVMGFAAAINFIWF